MDSSIVGKCCWVSGAISHNEWEPVGVPALVEAHFSLHSLLIWPGTDTEPILRDQIWQLLSLCSAVLFLLGWAWASLSFNNMYVHAIPSRSAHTALFCSHLLPRFVPSQKCKALCCVDPMRVGSAKNWYTAFLGGDMHQLCTLQLICQHPQTPPLKYNSQWTLLLQELHTLFLSLSVLSSSRVMLRSRYLRSLMVEPLLLTVHNNTC